jgi:hypothetical protein
MPVIGTPGDVETKVRRANAAIGAALLVLSFAVSGCGGSSARTSNLRPPSPINIGVEIGDDEISASPANFGAGPVVIIASNQSSGSQTLTIEGPRLKQSVGPISPEDTATLKVTVEPGEYTLTAGAASSSKPARLTVGTKRPSAQNKLLQP